MLICYVTPDEEAHTNSTSYKLILSVLCVPFVVITKSWSLCILLLLLQVRRAYAATSPAWLCGLLPKRKSIGVQHSC
jgi:hypothetical protein